MRRDVRIERVLPYPRERVWHALSDRESLSRWLMPTDFVPEVGHAFTFQMKPQAGWDGVTHCVVTELVARERIAYSYRGSARGDKPIACAGVEDERVRSLARSRRLCRSRHAASLHARRCARWHAHGAGARGVRRVEARARELRDGAGLEEDPANALDPGARGVASPARAGRATFGGCSVC